MEKSSKASISDLQDLVNEMGRHLNPLIELSILPNNRGGVFYISDGGEVVQNFHWGKDYPAHDLECWVEGVKLAGGIEKVLEMDPEEFKNYLEQATSEVMDERDGLLQLDTDGLLK